MKDLFLSFNDRQELNEAIDVLSKIAIPEYFKKLLINHIMQSHTLYLENERALREGGNIKFCGIEVIDHYKDEIVIFDFSSMDFEKNNKVLDLNDLKIKEPNEINFIK